MNGRNRIPAGNVVEAKYASRAPLFKLPDNMTLARKQGVKYEAKAQDYIANCVAKVGEPSPHLKLIQSPWLVFRSEHDRPDYERYCQPDAIIIDEWQRKLTIVEVKLQHCIDAHFQIRQLYEPVLRKMYPGYEFAAVELVQWHDPHVAWPEVWYFCENILHAEINRIGVHMWNPRYDKRMKKGVEERTPAVAARSNVPPLD